MPVHLSGTSLEDYVISFEPNCCDAVGRYNFQFLYYWGGPFDEDSYITADQTFDFHVEQSECNAQIGNVCGQVELDILDGNEINNNQP